MPLRKRGQRSVFESVVDKLEAEAQEVLAQREQRQASSQHLSRQSHPPSPPIGAPSRVDRPRVDSPPPSPQYEEITVDTCAGPATIRLPLVPGEDELSREIRIFDLEAELQKDRERLEIARIAARIRDAHPDTAPPAPVTSPPLRPPATLPPAYNPLASPLAQPPTPTPNPTASLDIASDISSPLFPSLSSPAAPSPSPNLDSEEDDLVLKDPFRVSSWRQSREPSLFPPLPASKPGTLFLFPKRRTALDDLKVYDDDETKSTNSDEVPISEVANTHR